MANPPDILVEIGYKIEQLKIDKAKVANQLKDMANIVQEKMRKVKDEGYVFKGMGKKESLNKLAEDMRILKQAASTYDSSFKKATVQKQQDYLKAKIAAKNYQKQLQKVKQAQQEAFDKRLFNPKKFQGWALSIMFFGMALQRFFLNLYNSSSKTFNEVMHSVEGTVTGFDMLQGSIAYLQFNLGQALEPIAMMIAPIIDAVAEWILNNQELAGWITATGIGLGGLFAIGGGGVLAVNGFIDLATKIGLAKQEADGLIKFDWGAIGKAIQKAVGIVAITYAVVQAKDAFDDFTSGKFVSGLINSLSTAFSGIGGIRMLQGKKGGGALFAIGVALDLVEQGKFFQTIFSITGIINAIFMTLVDAIKFNFQNGIYNGIINGAINAVDTLLLHIPGLVGKIFGIDPITELKNLIGTYSGEFDWMTNYLENYGTMTQLGSNWDNSLSKLIETGNLLSSLSSGGMYTTSNGTIVETTNVQNQYIIQLPSGGTSVAYSQDQLLDLLNRANALG